MSLAHDMFKMAQQKNKEKRDADFFKKLPHFEQFLYDIENRIYKTAKIGEFFIVISQSTLTSRLRSLEDTLGSSSEIIPELVDYLKSNLEKSGFNVLFNQNDRYSMEISWRHYGK